MPTPSGGFINNDTVTLISPNKYTNATSQSTPIIIYKVVSGGGTTPTGTKSITANGVYDVTDYASADVQVPTTAPAHCVEKAVEANGKLVNSTNVINLSGVTDIGTYALAYDYYGGSFPANTNIDLSSLTTISGQYGCNSMFQDCAGLTSVNISSLTTASGQYGCNSMLSGCTSLMSVDLSSLTTVSGANACANMLSGCAGLTNFHLSSLTTVSGTYACYYMFYGCTGLTNIALSSLTTISGGYGCNNMFYGCTSLTNIDLSSLTTVSGTNGCQYMFRDCSNLTSVDLLSLTTVSGQSSCANMFRDCANLTSLSFPSITPNSFGSYTNQFNNMCYRALNITLHFPSNTQAKVKTLSGYSATAPFGATAGTVLFDLPSTYTLTGADSKTYSRNPKYDTATALAWKVGAYGTTDFTPAYYTSGTTDPVVGNTIYSDSSCTTAVTTITAVA